MILSYFFSIQTDPIYSFVLTSYIFLFFMFFFMISSPNLPPNILFAFTFTPGILNSYAFDEQMRWSNETYNHINTNRTKIASQKDLTLQTMKYGAPKRNSLNHCTWLNSECIICWKMMLVNNSFSFGYPLLNDR